MPYSENKKIGGLDQFTPPLGDNDNIVVEQSGTAKRATLANLFAKLFNITTTFNGTNTSDSAVVIQNNGTVGKVSLNALVPATSVTNEMLVGNIANDKLDTISAPGKVADGATSAAWVNTAGSIVKRDPSGNFAAGTITASLSGNASTATHITGGAVGNVLYQSASGVTAKLANDSGTSGKFLRSNGAANPSWESFTSTLTTASALTGGVAGDIPYQTSPSNTIFLNAGTSGAVLTTSGAGQNPTWTNVATTTPTSNTLVKRDNDGNFAGGTITATALNVGTITASGAITGNASSASRWATARTLTFIGDVAASLTVDGSTVVPDVTATIQPNAITTAKIASADSTTTGVTNAKLRYSSALSVIGRSGNTVSSPADIVATANSGHVLRESGAGAIGFGQVNTAGIADSAVTRAKMSSDAVSGLAKGLVRFNNTALLNSYAFQGSFSVTRTGTGTYDIVWSGAPESVAGVTLGSPMPISFIRIKAQTAGNLGWTMTTRDGANVADNIASGEYVTVVFY